ncbi:hypothetical protein B0H19DRAFT_920627 [Mycena capillaripes]|nr:hypothetical protein B0H19DRAFT_920627 [Mycena capillaripes]
MNHKLFRSVKYYVPETLPQERRSQITQVIESNGGERAQSIHSATHIVTNSYRFQGWQDVPDGVKVVTDLWVDRTMILGQLLPCELYSAHPGQIFSGIVACGSGISATDLPTLEAGINALGGQWRRGLTKDVTHVFATSPDSDEYAIAMKHQETTHIKVLLPHWFDDAMRLGLANLSTSPYEWPDPKVLHPLPSEEEGKKEKAEKSSRKLSAAKRAFYKTAIWDPDKGGQFPGKAEPAGEEVWGGRKILLSPSLGLDDDKRRVLEDAVETAGGLILYYASDNEDGQEEEENERVSECDVLVTRWRAGRAFFKAIEEGKVVGTLNWVFYVHATGVLSSPMDQLLHYPVRKVPLENFSSHQITVTNYTGEARDYLKRLIHTMGAKFTPNMTGSNSVLIAAHMGGVKTEKALSWNIPVVNHVWLEDCFVYWRNATPAVKKYIDFPPNLDFAPMLAERRLMLTMDDLGNEEDEDINARARPSSERPPVGTEASAREVEGMLGDMMAGPGRDSAPRKTQRTESLRALADERVSLGGSKKQPAVSTSSAAGPLAKSQRSSTDGAKKTTRSQVEDDSDEVMPDALSKLGAKTVTQVSECTHLIAPGLVRTEKFLCALAAGAFILSEKWAIESAAANKLLPEEDYILRDKVSERKWNFRLVDAMTRAKEVGGKLFENKTFYVTSRVPVDTKLLKTVVTIQGGKISTQTPTVRILNSAPDRYVISCPEDISTWRPLAKDHAIYSQELLLNAAMTQQIEWDNPKFQVTDSA